MPSKNTTRLYVENGFYHIYNRGVEKRRIFQEAEDYKKFLHYLKIYLSPIESVTKEFPLLRANLVKANLSEQLDLLCYCLMPNHFHLLIKQKTKDAITKLMRQVMTSYSMYFNNKYNRVGPLFQGKFKAAIIENDPYLLHLSRYIHQNPKERGIALSDFPWSSYSFYINKNEHEWLKPNQILEYFSNMNKNFTYKGFVEDNLGTEVSIEKITLES